MKSTSLKPGVSLKKGVTLKQIDSLRERRRKMRNANKTRMTSSSKDRQYEALRKRMYLA